MTSFNKYTHVFEPIRIGNMTVKNRIQFSPMVSSLSTPSGGVSSELLGYVKSQAGSIYLAYVTTQADALYAQVAAQAVREQLIQSGYSEAQADAYLQTADGQTLVAQTVSNMTEEQKAQILNAAVAKLTDEQKEQILQGAVASLTEEQKAEIYNMDRAEYLRFAETVREILKEDDDHEEN